MLSDGDSRATTSTESTPLSASNAFVSCVNLSLEAMIVAGVPDPAGKCASSNFWPSRASETPRTISLCGTPFALIPMTPILAAINTTELTIQIVRGRPLTNAAIFAHMPCLFISEAVFAGSYFGIRGQKTLRPTASNIAGKKLSALIIAIAIPIAPTGPSALFELRSDSSRHNKPTITVPPAASTGSNEPFSAASIDRHVC